MIAIFENHLAHTHTALQLLHLANFCDANKMTHRIIREKKIANTNCTCGERVQIRMHVMHHGRWFYCCFSIPIRTVTYALLKENRYNATRMNGQAFSTVAYTEIQTGLHFAMYYITQTSFL